MREVARILTDWPLIVVFVNVTNEPNLASIIGFALADDVLQLNWFPGFGVIQAGADRRMPQQLGDGLPPRGLCTGEKSETVRHAMYRPAEPVDLLVQP